MTFTEFVSSLGIIPPDYFIPGRWQRTGTITHPKSKRASVMLDARGDFGLAQDWATMTECAVWQIGDKAESKTERTAEENATLSERLAIRRREEMRGTMRAQTAYAKAEYLMHANHEYLRKKQLDMNGCRGLKVDSEGWLVVPMYRDKQLISVQRISNKGDKRFAVGAPTKGAFFTIWRPGAPVKILCEGLATGLAIFAACPMAQVIVCFSAANLVAVAEREDWSGMVAIGADNDFWTEEIHGKNPGVEAAKRAAEIIGCGYAVPTCEGTDWHDLFQERLAMIEKTNQEKSYPTSPHQVRQAALLPVRVALMSCARNVSMSIPAK